MIQRGRFLGFRNAPQDDVIPSIEKFLAKMQESRGSRYGQSLLQAALSSDSMPAMRENVRGAMDANQAPSSLLGRLLNLANPAGAYSGPMPEAGRGVSNLLLQDIMQQGGLSEEERDKGARIKLGVESAPKPTEFRSAPYGSTLYDTSTGRPAEGAKRRPQDTPEGFPGGPQDKRVRDQIKSLEDQRDAAGAGTPRGKALQRKIAKLRAQQAALSGVMAGSGSQKAVFDEVMAAQKEIRTGFLGADKIYGADAYNNGSAAYVKRAVEEFGLTEAQAIRQFELFWDEAFEAEKGQAFQKFAERGGRPQRKPAGPQTTLTGPAATAASDKEVEAWATDERILATAQALQRELGREATTDEIEKRLLRDFQGERGR